MENKRRKEEGKMKCPKCGGPMYGDMCIANGERCEFWHCVICGECLDEVIVANRSRRVVVVEEDGDEGV